VRIEEAAQRNTDVARTDVGKPIHRASTSWAKVLGQLAAVLTVADEDGRWPRHLHLILLEIGTDAESRSSPALTLLAVAYGDDDRVT